MKPEEIDLERVPALKRELLEYRRSGLAAAERPEEFWERQRRAVMDKVAAPPKRSYFKAAMAWSAVIAAVLLFISLWVESPKASPVPDFAGGYDQDLLCDVERLTADEAPVALQPAYILVTEIQNAGESKVMNK